MSVAIIRTVAVTDGGIATVRASAKFAVRNFDARINDVRAHARACDVIVVNGIERQIALVNTVQSPRRAGLRGFVHARGIGLRYAVG